MASSIFIPGDLVISTVGDGDGSGTYTDNQGSPITLRDISTTGVVNGTLVLPQTTTVNAQGVTESAISGEYGSSSEGSLERSADGQSLTIAGYGVNAAVYNAAEASGGSNAYGNAALAQTTSLTNQTTYSPVARVIADVNYAGTVDTSTALYNVFNGNNPRSVVTVNGSSFTIAGQGLNKTDTATQGVFSAVDGASSATQIDGLTDTRTVEISGGNLYVSTDSKEATAGNTFTANISQFSNVPTSASTPTILPGISQSVTLTAGQANGVNNASIGSKVSLSPENYFFANATTLYVADGGNPKGGGLGDGGLQKWTLANGTWSLNYTLSAGLNLKPDTTADPGQGGQATTGLIGLTGMVNANGTVSLYASNATVGDLNQTYLYGITDTLSATTLPANESFTTLVTAAADTNIRGVALAPQIATVCFCTGTRIRVSRGGRVEDVTVEALGVGDLAVTASGACRPIVWIGHREVACSMLVAPHESWPVRVLAGAFGIGSCGRALPERDLLLSPGHPVLVGFGPGEVLVPIMCLINGTSIARAPCDHVTYWHVELDSHDILLAEGLPSESFLDYGNRGWFGDAAAPVLLDPDYVAPGLAGRCRPVRVDGPVVDAERRRLDALFATRLASACAWPEAWSLDTGFGPH